jgi:hypothetical protein
MIPSARIIISPFDGSALLGLRMQGVKIRNSTVWWWTAVTAKATGGYGGLRWAQRALCLLRVVNGPEWAVKRPKKVTELLERAACCPCTALAHVCLRLPLPNPNTAKQQRETSTSQLSNHQSPNLNNLSPSTDKYPQLHHYTIYDDLPAISSRCLNTL